MTRDVEMLKKHHFFIA